MSNNFFVDYDDVAQNEGSSGSGAMKFGLNQNAVISEFNRFQWESPDGTPNQTLKVEFQFEDANGNIIMNRNGDKPISKSKLISLPLTVNVSKEHGGGQTDDLEHPDFQAVIKQKLAEVTGYIHVILGESYRNFLKQAESGANNVKEYFNNVIELVESKKFQSMLEKPIPCDLFLCYPYTPKTNDVSDEGAKYLDIPSNIKHGRIVYLRQKGNFVLDENQPEDAKLKVKPLVYINENKEIHPIKRTAWFASSDFAKREAIADTNAGGQNWSTSSTDEDDDSSGGW